jgi:NADPH-dependent glutamate synthase beta subunit-like oxidoreductase
VRAQQLVQQSSVIEGGRAHPLTPGWELVKRERERERKVESKRTRWRKRKKEWRRTDMTRIAMSERRDRIESCDTCPALHVPSPTFPS